jgi:hypothetical protein
MTLLQNETRGTPANVLIDQGVPNTLGGIDSPILVGQMRLPAGIFVALAIPVLVGLAILATRLL